MECLAMWFVRRSRAGFDEPPDISPTVKRVMIDAKNGPRH